jgi:predicted Zn-dependent protease
MNDLIERLEAMLASGQDNALLRFGLGQALLKEGRATDAAPHLVAAVEHDRAYSAAWKLLGKAYLASGDAEAAAAAYRNGIAAATGGGDKQAVKEMEVFLRRIERDR